MNYFSTRGDKTPAKASAAILRGAAADGGLYAPETFPRYMPDDLAEQDYGSLAQNILSLYLTDFPEADIRACVQSAYTQGWDDPRVAPLVSAGGAYFLELFHGRTLAFKDMALSILPHLMQTAKRLQNVSDEIAILTATSGDTGGAALAGFAGVGGFKAMAFYPEGGVSDVQRRQMVTREEPNVSAVAVRGNFDDAQRGVKRIFADTSFNERLNRRGIRLSSANSINIGRLLPQIVYYYYAYGQLRKQGALKAGDPLNFAVPTGNFGNILAGYYARQMGLPIGHLLCASNVNNVLYDFFQTGAYDANRPFTLTASPSMDILVSSNLERLLYDLSGRDGARVAALMRGLATDGRYAFDASASGIRAQFATEAEAAAALAALAKTGYVMDPHTAVAYAALQKAALPGVTVVTATASPYKFTETVARAAGAAFDAAELPAALRGLAGKPVVHAGVCDQNDMQSAAEAFLCP